MQHNLIHSLRSIESISLTPVVANGICKYGTSPVERRRADGSTDFGIAFKSMLGILVPEMECSITAGGAERTMYRMPRDVIDRINVGDIPTVGRSLAVAFERKVRAIWRARLVGYIYAVS